MLKLVLLILGVVKTRKVHCRFQNVYLSWCKTTGQDGRTNHWSPI